MPIAPFHLFALLLEQRSRVAGHLSCRLYETWTGSAATIKIVGRVQLEKESVAMAKGQVKPKKENKPKLSTKEKQQKKKEKKAGKG